MWDTRINFLSWTSKFVLEFYYIHWKKKFDCINWNSSWKSTNQNFLIESILVKLIGILIDMMRIFWFVYFQPEIFFSVETFGPHDINPLFPQLSARYGK